MRIPSFTEEQKKINQLDNAYLNAILSYAIYSKNSFWFETWFKKRKFGTLIEKDFWKPHLRTFKFDEKKFIYDKVFANLVNEVFTPIDLNIAYEQEYKSSNYLYDYKGTYFNGIYKAQNNLAAASAVKKLNPDGTYTMHIIFRGTDTNEESMLKFIFKAYLDMNAYYDCFKPFEKACLEYANNPVNNISKIEISGHSLGGAMVQQFFSSQDVINAKLVQSMQGFTYGSPPAIPSPFYSIFPAIRHAIVNKKFLNIVETTYNFFSIKKTYEYILDNDSDNRITQYQHFGDIVTRLGQFFLKKKGKHIVHLKDAVSDKPLLDNLISNDFDNKYINTFPYEIIVNKHENKFQKFLNIINTTHSHFIKKPIRFIKRMGNTTYHDMSRYIINLQEEIKSVQFDKKTTTINLIRPMSTHYQKFVKIALSADLLPRTQPIVVDENELNEGYLSIKKLKAFDINTVNKFRNITASINRLKTN